ncbi:nucleoid-structuring protein H-NS [Mycobacterium simiae]|uniref:Nucleoid-structuring protein H-NS n=1 Tax=Mycobacterium simiae TaxID=1784 RepID=A0A5B1BP79_MYCSI|nr:nucleoid-structuring protein H-NS [Mycobacterium simiae]KAA1250216.1 nucleoid-structuring protein H-NS [Mycobacterium simiae]
MADPQDRPNSEPDGTPGPPAKKQPAKKAAKAPAKKAPAKKAPAKKAPAKKVPAKKTPAQAPAAEPAQVADQSASLQQRAKANGELAAAAKDAAAQAKSTVDSANNPLSREFERSSSPSAVPLLVAVALSLLAVLLIRQLRRR